MRQPPPPLLRLSAGAGEPREFSKDKRQLTPWADHYTSSVRTSSVPPSTPHRAPHCNNNTPSPPAPVHTISSPYTRHSRSSSSGTPLFSSIKMFRMGTKSRSPRRAASTMYSTAPTSTPSTKPSSPTSSMVVPEPLQRPFSPWGSSDSQSSTSPRNSTRMSKGAFNKRTGSPTASVGTSNTGTSTMSTRSKGFLSRGRKNLQSNLNDNTEFDPTTFRKNRTRPARGLKGQDALYGEYEDLFDDSLDEDINEDSFPSDGGEDEDGFLLLRLDVEENSISPRTRFTPRSVPMPKDMRQSGSDSPPPPIPPPKLWRRSLDVTTPPRSAAASVDEPLTVPDTALYDTPPTPPPKPTIFVFDTDHTSTGESEEIHVHVASPGPPPHRPPPTAPDGQKRLSKRLSRLGEYPTSVPEGLGIINIPSPTLFYSSFIPGASDTLMKSPSHATKSPALTSRSYTPRQPAYETNPADDDFIPEGMSLLFDEADGLGVLPLFFSKYSTTDQETSSRGSTDMTQVSLDDLPTENPGDVSASTEKSIETLMETLVETTDTFKEVAGDDKDVKEAIPELLVTEGDGAAKLNDAIAKPEQSKSAPAMKDSEDQTPAPEKEDDDAKDSSYLRAFRAFVKGSGDLDPFVHRMPRFDALQAQRICSHLRKDYPLIAGMNKRKSSTPKIPGPTSANVRQREVGEEILTSLWALMALRWMNFGRVVISPGHETLLAASAKRLTRRATVKMDQRATQMLENVMVEVSVADHERRRVLDLGGLPIGMSAFVKVILSFTSFLMFIKRIGVGIAPTIIQRRRFIPSRLVLRENRRWRMMPSNRILHFRRINTADLRIIDTSLSPTFGGYPSRLIISTSFLLGLFTLL